MSLAPSDTPDCGATAMLGFPLLHLVAALQVGLLVLTVKEAKVSKMCCQLARGHSQVTEQILEAQGPPEEKNPLPPPWSSRPSGSSSDPSIWPGVLSSFRSIPHVRPPCGLSSFQVMTSAFSPPSSWSLLQGQGCRLTESAKTPSFWHLSVPSV